MTEKDTPARPGAERSPANQDRHRKSKTISLDDALVKAIELHRKGRQTEARSIYNAILEANPAHTGALHFLGILFFQNAKHKEAIELIELALQYDPNYTDARNNLGNIYLKQKNYQDAESAYRKVLHASPDHADAINNLAAVLKAQGKFDESLTCFQMALKLTPDNATVHYNLGNAYCTNQQWTQAKAAYAKAIEIDPAHAAAYRELGGVLKALGQPEEALQALTNAVQLDESNADTHRVHGIALQTNGLVEDAVRAYHRAIACDPSVTDTYPNLITALHTLDRLSEAEKIVNQWLEQDPASAAASHMHASITGDNVPPRATDAYVTKTFDDFSTRFDEKLQSLEYKAPQLLHREALAAGIIDVDRPRRIVDAGCGTGLCGPLFRPYASVLDGVDLSGGMLSIAKLLAVYDTLTQAELTRFLQTGKDHYHIIITADTMIYFGDLQPVVAACSRRLTPDGWFVFSAEKLITGASQSGYQLNWHGRYSHAEPYLRKTLEQHGFINISVTEAVLRLEHGEPVDGFIVLAQNTTA